MATARDLSAAKAALDLCSWLDGHGADLRSLLLTEGRLRHFSKGQWAFGEGDDAGGIFTVVTGMFQVYAQSLGDREVLLNQLTRGSTIGQSARFGGGPRLVTAVSLGESLALQVDDEALARISEQHPLIWKAVANLHYVQLRGMVRMLAEFASLPPRQRLAARLLRFAVGREMHRTLQLAQQDLADMTGLSRKTVNACLSDLEERGFVRRQYAVIEIVDMAGLRAFAAAPGGRG